MRLTLRTLLAYLDNTLDPNDAESLRVKVAESGFAGQLVQRIRTNLAKTNLSAPAPDAVGPVEEANVISEYLDSTLSAEQISEIERACLESDQQLAEAAACHQILTMVLGKTAEVSPELRQRIYSLPDRDIADLATAGSFSSVLSRFRISRCRREVSNRNSMRCMKLQPSPTRHIPAVWFNRSAPAIRAYQMLRHGSANRMHWKFVDATR